MEHAPGFLALNDAKSRVRQITLAAGRRRAVAGGPLALVDVREDREWGQAS